MRNNDDFTLLSAYLDGALSTDERTALEARLSSEPELQEQLDELRYVVTLLREMPRQKAPRSYTLDPATYGRKAAPVRRIIYPWRALGAVAATMVILIAGALFFSNLRGNESADRAVDSVSQTTMTLPSETQDAQVEVANAPTPTSRDEDRTANEDTGSSTLFFEETVEPTLDEALASELAQGAADTALQVEPEQAEELAAPYDPYLEEGFDPEQAAMESGGVPSGVASQSQIAPEAGSGGAGGEVPPDFGGAGGGGGDADTVPFAAEMPGPVPMPTMLPSPTERDREEDDSAAEMSMSAAVPAVPSTATGASEMSDAAEPASAENEGFVDDALARKLERLQQVFHDLLGIFQHLLQSLDWNG